MILYDAIPGQETGNVQFVVENRIGVFAPNPRAVTEAVTAWLAEGADKLHQRSERARSLGRPNAVWEIADEIWEQAQNPPIATNRRNRLQELSARMPVKVRLPK